MSSPVNPTGRRIAQLLRLACSSEHQGETAAAIEAINRGLTSAGLDFHELAKVVEAGLQRASPKRELPVRRSPGSTGNKPRRPGGRPLSMDEVLICDAPNGLFRPCACGGIIFTVMPGIGPHVAQMICDGCSRGGRWLSRQYFGATS
jgi:hypothetical protein